MTALIDRIWIQSRDRPRFLVAIAGPPASGKSTLAQVLAKRLPAALLPMDGFHLDNEVLQQRGLIQRKGAPQTFDVAGFVDLVRRVREPGRHLAPAFDRAGDRVLPDALVIPARSRIIVVEGNYLLLDAPVWRALHGLWDLTVCLTVPDQVLETRLVDRWRRNGLDPWSALRRARDNDLRNARTVRDGSVPAMIALSPPGSGT